VCCVCVCVCAYARARVSERQNRVGNTYSVS